MRAILLAAAVLSALASPASGETVDEDLVPGGKVTSSLFPSAEVETYRVAAPAGSVLSVDLGPARKGAFAPLLVATLSDGTGAIVPAPGRTGRTRAKIPFPVDGVLRILVLSGRGGAGDYLLRTKLKVPGGFDFAGLVTGPEGDSFEYFAPAGAPATVTVRSGALSEVIPTIASLEGPGGPVEAGKRRANPRMDQWLAVPQPDSGPWTLTVVGNILTTGPFTGTVRWKAPRGPDEDHRGISDPAALDGSYAALLAVADASSGSFPALLAGGVDFDGRGRARTRLETLGLAVDPASPFGIGFSATPVAGDTGSCYTDGLTASVSLDLSENHPVTADFQVAAGASVLYTGVGAGPSPATGLLLARTAVPTKAELAGQWLYMDAGTGGGGASTIEVGTLFLDAGGTVIGGGARTDLALVGGTPTPGAQAAVIRTGTFSVGADGTVTVVTVPDFVGAPETWTSRTAFRADILAGLDATGGGGRLFLRRGLDLSDADVAGDYLHFGVSFGSALRLRTGILGFDGAGAFAGSETVADLSGGTPPATVPVTGTYSVDAQGIATFGIDGGPQGTGIVGPAARYLFTVSLDGAGVGFDLLLDLE